jgi:hypothetical protein
MNRSAFQRVLTSISRGGDTMKQINIDDQVYEQLEKEAARLHLDVDTYLSTVLMREASPLRRTSDAGSEHDIPKEISGIGLFADIPEIMDKIVADAMAARARRWQSSEGESYN